MPRLPRSSPSALRAPRPLLLGCAAALLSVPAGAAAAPKPVAPKPVPVLADAGNERITLAAGEGHVLAIQATPPQGSRLIELVAGQEPRPIRTLPDGVPPFSVGTDAAGRVVAIASVCPASRPRCDLSVIDVETGATVALAGTTTAYLGDLDHGRAVLARPARKTGVRVSLRSRTPGKAAIAMPISRVAQRAPGSEGTYPKTRLVTALDLQDGVVAASMTIENDMVGFDALLIARGPKQRDWRLLDRLSNGDGGEGNHYYSGPVVTKTGIRAFADWGLEDESYAARWSLSGKRLKSIDTETIGLGGFFGGAALNGDTLVALPVLGFFEPNDPHPALASGPLKLG